MDYEDNLSVRANCLDINSLNFIMLGPYDFTTAIHASNRFFTANLNHYCSFVISNHNSAWIEYIQENNNKFGENKKNQFLIPPWALHVT